MTSDIRILCFFPTLFFKLLGEINVRILFFPLAFIAVKSDVGGSQLALQA